MDSSVPSFGACLPFSILTSVTRPISAALAGASWVNPAASLSDRTLAPGICLPKYVSFG